MNERTSIWLLLPAALLAAAVLPLPYGYYTFLRIVVTISAIIAAYSAYAAKSSLNAWVVVMALVAVLFNPLLPVTLGRSTWLPIDLVAACIFAYVALRRDTRAME